MRKYANDSMSHLPHAEHAPIEAPVVRPAFSAVFLAPVSLHGVLPALPYIHWFRRPANTNARDTQRAVNTSEPLEPKDSIFSGLALGCGAQLVVLIITGVLLDQLTRWLNFDWGWCLYTAWITQWLALAPLIRIKRREGALRAVNGLLTMGGLLMLVSLIIWAVAADLAV